MRIHDSIDFIKKLSDRVVGVGPVSIGLDGILTWVPGIGAVYGLFASLWIILQGVRARISPLRIAQLLGILAVDNGVIVIPLAGQIVDTLFQGHLYAAKVVQAEIEKTHYIEKNWKDARADGSWESDQMAMREAGKRRLIYLR